MTLIQTHHLKIAYSGNIAVEDVSLEIRSGEYTCMIGNNGSGKSSLLKAMLGLVPVESGSVTLNIDKSKISYLPQINLTSPTFPATVSEIVLCGTQKSERKVPWYTKKDKEAAYKAMEILGITGIAGQRIGRLSGGQQQRVMLARTLCREPELLILDEPCAGLDPIITAELYEILNNLNKEYHVGILMASHDMQEVRKYADRIIVVRHDIEFDGSVSEWERTRNTEED